MDDFMDFEALTAEPEAETQLATVIPNLNEYDRIILAFSGGKDSLACLLRLLDLGVPREKLEIHHHLVDGIEGSSLMDWPCTHGYCKAIAKAFGIPITFSHRVGGFEREMLRNGTATAPVCIPFEDGYITVGGQGPEGTRRKFPQVSASLSQRWCSSLCSQVLS